MKDFLIPISRSMEPHLKEIGDLSRDVKNSVSGFSKQMAVSEKDLEKAGKSGQTQLVEAMENFNKKKDEVDKQKAEILLNVLLKERERYIFIIELYLQTLQYEIALGKSLETQSVDIQRWKDICQTKNSLSEEQITALATASDLTFKQINSEQPNEENVVFLYKSTSLALKNLDHVEEKTESPLKISKSHYISRTKTQRSERSDPMFNQVDTENIPIGFPLAPEKVSERFDGKDRAQYKIWMRKKATYDNWLNSLIAYRIKEKEGDTLACQNILRKLAEENLNYCDSKIGLSRAFSSSEIHSRDESNETTPKKNFIPNYHHLTNRPKNPDQDDW